MNHSTILLLLGWSVVLVNASANAVKLAPCPAPIKLSCELLLDPAKTVIYDPRPELAWECGADSEAFLQSACQIVVSEVTANGDGAVVWDSGRIGGGDSLNLEYAGEPLLADHEYTWQVRSWDGGEQPSRWSKSQQFRMADQLSETETSRYSVGEIQRPAQVARELDDRSYLIDFGTAAFGYLRIRVDPVDVPRELQLTFGEKLSGGRVDLEPGGSIRTYRTNVTVPANDTQVEVHPPIDRRNTTGSAIRLPKTVGVVAPFRYVEISGLPSRPNNEDIVQIRIEYPFDDTAASFKSSDDTLNSVWELCKYSIRATTFCGVYVDGDRERIPYEADAYINQLSHYGVDREYALARYSHEYLLENPTWPTEWKQHSVLMAFADYLYTGNSESLQHSYEILKSEKLLTSAEREDGLLDTSNGYHDIVDWPETERDGFEMLPVNTVVNAFHFATLEKMAYLAGVLGKKQEQDSFKNKAEEVKERFNNVFWNDHAQAYVDGEGSLHSSIHSNLFPLAFGLVPESRETAVVEFIKSRKMQCSVYAAQYLLKGLYHSDQDRYALQLLTSRDKRSWFNMIKSGSTITLEAWDQAFKPNLDWNHAWGAAPANLIPAYLVGVRPTQPGFKEFVVQPRPGDLESFKAKVPTPRGAVQVRYAKKGQRVELDVVVPGNAKSRIGIPLHDAQASVEVLHNREKVSARFDSAHAWIDGVPPGRHSFQLNSGASITQPPRRDSIAN